MEISPVTPQWFSEVIALWGRAGLARAWNDPDDDLRRAVASSTSDVLIGVDVSRLVAAVMVGHDGHRGWVYYLAVDPGARASGYGRAMMAAAETWLKARGVPKLNLMVRGDNEQAVSFYRALGYTADDVSVLSRRMDSDEVTIRAGRDGDAKLLLELFDGAVAWLVSRGQTGQWGSEPFSATPRGVARINDLAAEDGLRIAEINGQGVGAIVTGSAPDYVLPAQASELYVLALISARVHAGRGIGARLIDHAKQKARQAGCRQLRVDCWAGSPALIGFYESVGFIKLDTFEVGGWSGQVLSMPVQDAPGLSSIVTPGGISMMRFGLLCSARASGDDAAAPPGQGLRDWLEFNEQAERLGFYSTFLVEHHFTGWGQVSATLTMLACLAMRTTTLRLGTGVLALPWHNPVLLAEQAATVDLMSDGRLDLGIGKGYRHAEFAGFGIDPEEGLDRFEEAVEVITRAWTSAERFTHVGDYWRFDDIVVEPKPVQVPHPPLWMAAGSESSVTRAAAAGHNLILDQYASPVQIAERIATYRSHLSVRPFDPLNVAVARNFYVADTETEISAARRRLIAGTERILGVSRDPDRPADGSHVLAYQHPGAADAHALYGRPDQIAEGLAALQQAGVTYVLLIPETDGAQLRRFRDDVIPLLSEPTVDPASAGP